MPQVVRVDFEADGADFRREARQAERDLDRFAREADNAGRRVRIFGRDVDASARRVRASTQAFRAVGAAVAAIGASAAVGGLIRGVTAAAEFGDELNNLSAAAGLTVEDFQRLSRLFEFGGAGTEQFSAGVVRLNRALAAAGAGSETAERALAQLGVTSTDTGTALRQAIATITPENFQRLLPAIQAVFGDDAIRVFASTLQLSGDEVERLIAEMTTLGTEGVGALSALNLELTGVRREFETAFAAEVAENADAIRISVQRLGEAVVNVIEPLARLAEFVLDNEGFWRRLLPGLYENLEGWGLIERAASEAVPPLAEAADTAVVLADALDEVADASGRIGDPQSIVGLRGLSEEYANLSRQIQDAGAELSARLANPQVFASGVAAVTELRDRLERIQLQLLTLDINAGLVEPFEEGASVAARVAAEADNVAVQFDRVSLVIASGFTQAVQSADSFADALGNIAQRLITIGAEAAILSAIGALTGQGDFGSIFSGLLGFRQQGGRVAPGRPYIVGERQPELFIPDAAGRIAPDVAGLEGGVTIPISVGAGVDEFGVRRAIAESIPLIDRLLEQYRLRRGG